MAVIMVDIQGALDPISYRHRRLKNLRVTEWVIDRIIEFGNKSIS